MVLDDPLEELANEVAGLKAFGRRGRTREQINTWIALLLHHLSQDDADRIVHRAALIEYERRNKMWRQVIAKEVAKAELAPLSHKEVREMFGEILPGRATRFMGTRR